MHGVGKLLIQLCGTEYPMLAWPATEAAHAAYAIQLGASHRSLYDLTSV